MEEGQLRVWNRGIRRDAVIGNKPLWHCRVAEMGHFHPQGLIQQLSFLSRFLEGWEIDSRLAAEPHWVGPLFLVTVPFFDFLLACLGFVLDLVSD